MSITSLLINLFNDETTNPNHAQLIITTHDIQLINKQLYDVDQIFVVEKTNLDRQIYIRLPILKNCIKNRQT